MHINVSDILIESVGFSRNYSITGERPTLEEIVLTEDIHGEISVARIEDSLLVRGSASTEVQLECHRCLSTFNRPVKVRFKQEYAGKPVDDQMPIVDGIIDLAPLIEQEIILNLPIKILCRPDCPGITDAGADYINHPDQPRRLSDQARITKGK
jgi:uncharacterized protein